jgi:hypothetical protein
VPDNIHIYGKEKPGAALEIRSYGEKSVKKVSSPRGEHVLLPVFFKKLWGFLPTFPLLAPPLGKTPLLQPVLSHLHLALALPGYGDKGEQTLQNTGCRENTFYP